jgi:hypothetical protein
MSFDAYLNSHMTGFPSAEEYRKASQIKNQKHNLQSYSSSYQPLYEMCNTYLSNGYSVLYGPESIPNKSAEEKVFENIINVNSEVQNYLSKGFLTVVNRDSIYEECGADYRSIVNFWNSNVNRIQKKLDGKTKGTMMLSVPDSYFKHDRHDIFMMFEKEMGKTFPIKSGMICWYKEEWLNSLSLASLIKVLITHKYVVYDDWKNKAWTANEIINLISKGIDKSLGEGSAKLLFQTMRTIHKLNLDVVVSRPVVFETTLKRLLGSDQQVSVMDSISKEIIERIMFCNRVL